MKAKDYAILDFVNCGVGHNTFTTYINHAKFRTLIDEGLSDLQPDSAPEWIHSHLRRHPIYFTFAEKGISMRAGSVVVIL